MFTPKLISFKKFILSGKRVCFNRPFATVGQVTDNFKTSSHS